MALAEIGRHVVEVGHAVDIEPHVRHRHNNIGVTEAKPRDDFGTAFPVGQVLAHQILAGDAEVDAAAADLARNLRGGHEHDLDIGAPADMGMVTAVVFRQADGKPGPRQYLQRLFLQPPLGGDGQRHAHARASLSDSTRSSHTEKPTPGMGWFAPSSVSKRS